MRVIKLQGKQDNVVITKNLINYKETNPIFVINGEQLIFKFIENLDIDSKLLYTLRLVREINLDFVIVELRERITDNLITSNILCLSDLLEVLNEDKINEYYLMIDTDDNDLISEIMQSFIYLKLNLEIVKKSEYRDRQVVNAFRMNYGQIKNAISVAERKLNYLNVDDAFDNNKQAMINILYDIDGYLAMAKERSLNIAVMATKKAGKSVIVNSFLGDQYCPTSLELPTPNACVYSRSKDNSIRVIYGKKEMLFKSSQEVYNYTYKEFKRAQDDIENGHAIEDMEINYRGNENDFASFTIVDTPGSNYALAKDTKTKENTHKNISYKWMAKSDVIIFVINYSNYLSNDEEEFLQEIKTKFEKLNKFYSLIVVVNKLDEIFLSECEDKSPVRFLDYVRCKLRDLGYKEFVVIGASARTYFDTISLCKLDSRYLIEMSETAQIMDLKGKELRERIGKLKERALGKQELSYLAFIDDQLEKYKIFYGFDECSLSDLRQGSGMVDLIKYTNFIAIQKATVELYGLLARNIDEEYIKLKNYVAVKTLLALKVNKNSDIREVEKNIEELVEYFRKVEKDTENKLTYNHICEKLLMNVQADVVTRTKDFIKICEVVVDEFFIKLATLDNEKLNSFMKSTNDEELIIRNTNLDGYIKGIIGRFIEEINKEAETKQEIISNAERLMHIKVDYLKDSINGTYDVTEFDIALPKIDSRVQSNLIVKVPEITLASYDIKKDIITCIDQKEGFMERIFGFFTRGKKANYRFNGKRARDIKVQILKVISNNINKENEHYCKLLEDNLNKCVDEFNKDTYKKFIEMMLVYKVIFTEISQELSQTKGKLQEEINQVDKKIRYLNDVESANSDFFNIWEKVREI